MQIFDYFWRDDLLEIIIARKSCFLCFQEISLTVSSTIYRAYYLKSLVKANTFFHLYYVQLLRGTFLLVLHLLFSSFKIYLLYIFISLLFSQIFGFLRFALQILPTRLSRPYVHRAIELWPGKVNNYHNWFCAVLQSICSSVCLSV